VCVGKPSKILQMTNYPTRHIEKKNKSKNFEFLIPTLLPVPHGYTMA
jgi:hypothetical protein